LFYRIVAKAQQGSMNLLKEGYNLSTFVNTVAGRIGIYLILFYRIVAKVQQKSIFPSKEVFNQNTFANTVAGRIGIYLILFYRIVAKAQQGNINRWEDKGIPSRGRRNQLLIENISKTHGFFCAGFESGSFRRK
jgi:hypothetical protein